MVVSPQELHDAILTNSLQLVNAYLSDGADPNMSPQLKQTSGNRETIRDFDKLLGSEDRETIQCISPLHVAVINFYHHRPKGTSTTCCTIARKQAKKIVESLLDHGADPSNEASGIFVCNIEDFKCKSPGDNITPVGLAIFFKKCFRAKGFTSHYAAHLDRVIELIMAKEQSAMTAVGTTSRATVANSVLKTWENLVFSEKFSDVTFVCKSDTDDEAPPMLLHAHMNVLAAASPYFSTYFGGPWAESHSDGRFETSNSEAVMRVVLRYIYTGRVNDSQLDLKVSSIFRVAKEYDLPDLISLCEASLVRQLSETSIKDTLQLAHLHGSRRLKQSCFDFVRQNCANVLMNPSMMSLATEDAELWAELGKAIAPAGNKRARTS